MKKWTISKKDYLEYLSIADDIINHLEYQKMKTFKHHRDISCYEHSVNVGLRSFIYGKKHKLNYIDMTRGALLHDFYLYDWHDKNKGFRLHGYKHPRFALNNANKYFQVNDLQSEIIINHMFPLTLFHFPKSKESFMVCMIDKLCTYYEMRNKTKKVEIID